jgi:hypothetical protein
MKSLPYSTPQTTDASLPSMLQRLVGDVRVLVMAKRPRLAGEFDAHISEALAMASSVRVVLVVPLDPEAEMDATERKKLVRAGLLDTPCAALMDGPFARAINTALHWLGVSRARCFAPQRLEEACDYLQIPQSLRVSIGSTIYELVTQMSHQWTPQLTPSGRMPAGDARSGIQEAAECAKGVVETADRVKSAVSGRVERIRGMATVASVAPKGHRTSSTAPPGRGES